MIRRFVKTRRPAARQRITRPRIRKLRLMKVQSEPKLTASTREVSRVTGYRGPKVFTSLL